MTSSVDPLRKLQAALPDLIGRRISRITVRQHDRGLTQLFLFFDDRTYYEFYGTTPIWGARQLDQGGIESIAPVDEIPLHGALHVIDRDTAIIVRPAATPTL